ncbi:MAG: VCBS repeat-containing protein [Rhizobiales bacterium]|nr:VCBS repeat-containing protein [Hyphomicrobiales bacterium]
MKLPRDIGPVHFVGVGGIGMSGIAEVLANLGYTVTGSDVADSANVKRLRDKGIKVSVGHRAENIDGADVIVVSTAIKRDNPELVAARAKRLPVVRRAEMLAELMRLKSCVAIAGTHGKTTTTSLVAALLDGGGLDPTVINGGIINAYGTNARLGAGDWMVVEADESDGTFLKLPADIAIVTNVDPEHLDHFHTFEAVQEAFRAFVENIPFYGFAVMCTDHPVVQVLVGKLEDRRVITYGENPQADVRLVDLDHNNGSSRFSVLFRDLDRDGSPDLYVCNDFHSPDRVWLNDGHGHFRAAPRLALRCTSTFAMGADVADLDRDGHDEVFVSDMLDPDHRRRMREVGGQEPAQGRLGQYDDRPQYNRNTLQYNRGDGTYAEIAQFAGLAASGWT